MSPNNLIHKHTFDSKAGKQIDASVIVTVGTDKKCLFVCIILVYQLAQN